MEYVSVNEIASKWGISERSVRNYCATGRVPGAKSEGGVWLIPVTAARPARMGTATRQASELLQVLRREDKYNIRGGIYHKVQVELTYNSNHIEGSRLTVEQTRYIFETNTIGAIGKFATVNTDDIVETANHFRCIDYIIDNANRQLSESMIKRLHFILKNGTSSAREDWFAVGEYKRLANEVGGVMTTLPEKVPAEMKRLLKRYRNKKRIMLDDLLKFHHDFECIHPFQDGNGRVGRLILFKECLRLGIVPFIIDDELKLFYYRGLSKWPVEPGYLRDTCLAAQDKFKKYLDDFGIRYS